MNTQIINLTPADILANSNIRYGLKKPRVAGLAEEIKALGYVHTNLTVEPLAEAGPNGESYLLVDGHYRRASVELLAKSGLEIELPCEVVEMGTANARVAHQISKNYSNEQMSPMDMAVAIDRLLNPPEGEEPMKKVDICNLFPRSGGRKGIATTQPLSNAMLNIYVSFLKFPKDIKTLIHEGRIGVGDAYKLTKKDKSEWPEYVKKAEAAIEASAGELDKLEEQVQAEAKKSEEAEAKAKQDAEALVNAQKVLEAAQAERDAKVNAAAEAFKAKAAVPASDKDKLKVAVEHFKAAEAEATAADKAASQAKKDADKLQQTVERNQKLAAERKAKLEQARKDQAAKANGKLAVGKAIEAADNGGKVPLKGPQIIALLNQLALPGFPKVQKIFQAVQRCIASDITDAQLTAELAYITGERKERPKHMPKEAK